MARIHKAGFEGALNARLLGVDEAARRSGLSVYTFTDILNRNSRVDDEGCVGIDDRTANAIRALLDSVPVVIHPIIRDQGPPKRRKVPSQPPSD